jgi:antitoxin component YwqK of YwqJK toxin-antitoxin module
MKKIIQLLFFIFFSNYLVGQNLKVVRYFSSDSIKIQNIYYVLESDPQVLNGPFWQFYENEKLAIKGKYVLGVSKGVWRYYFENGRLKLEAHLKNRNEGDWTYYYESGEKMKQGQLNGQREEGYWQYFYENGVVQKQGDYLKGKKEGKWEYFFEDSVHKAEVFFENGEGLYREYYYQGTLKMEGPLMNGHSEGVWTYYYNKGGIKAKGLELDGKKNGHWAYHFTDGSKSSEGTYTNGKQQGSWLYYYQNGKIRTTGLVSQGNRQGEWMLFHDDGTIKGDVVYTDDLGAYVEYYSNGQIRVEGQLEGTSREGLWNYYYESGNKEGDCLFTNGVGSYEGFYPNGDLKAEGELDGNNKIGLWKLYDIDGKVVYLRTIYDEDPDRSPETGVSTQPIDSITIVNIETTKKIVKPSTKVFKYKQTSKWRKNVRWLKPKPNEAKGLIVGGNPFSIVANSFPISVEYIIQERQGFQIRYQIIRQPFFLREDKVPLESVYKKGNAVDIIGKVYSRNTDHGMLYFGPSFRLSSVNHFVKALDSSSTSEEIKEKTLHAQEQTYEFAFMFGDRMVRTFKQNSLTFEMFVGVGIGYRNFRKNYDVNNEYFDSLYINTSQSKLFLPIRLGFSIGYFFR